MTIIEMFSDLKINLKNMSEFVWVRPNTISNKMSQWYDITEEEMSKLREYLDRKVREMIKIIKKIDKVLDHN
jgi:hypothetical protein